MARGRIISPDFWSDGRMVRLTPFARLLYIGMWNFAYCDKGHLPDDAMDLKLKILPADPVDPDALLEELTAAGRVLRETGNEGTFLSIPKFGHHQKADDPRWDRKCPICKTTSNHDGGLPSTTEHDRARQTTSNLSVEGRGVERSREGVESDGPTPYCPKHPNGTDSPCGPCRTARIAFEAVQAAKKNKPTPQPGRANPKTCKHRKHKTENYCVLCDEVIA